MRVPCNASKPGGARKRARRQPGTAQSDVRLRAGRGIGTQTAAMVLHDRVALQPGERIKVAPDLSKAHLFSVEGNRLN